MDSKRIHPARLFPGAAALKLLKLIVGPVVAALFVATGLPEARDLMTRTSVAAAADAFVEALNSARLEAARRKVPVTLCKSLDPDHPSPHCAGNTVEWPEGWIAFVDRGAVGAVDGSDQVLFTGRAGRPIDTAIEFPSRMGSVTFHPVGPITGPAGGFELRWASALSTGTYERVICLSVLGRASAGRPGTCQAGTGGGMS
jgi:Tfp pilus assembly protein FimT